MSKGTIQRPHDKNKFDTEWERIFGVTDGPEFKPMPSASLSETPCLDYLLDLDALNSALSNIYSITKYL